MEISSFITFSEKSLCLESSIFGVNLLKMANQDEIVIGQSEKILSLTIQKIKTGVSFYLLLWELVMTKLSAQATVLNFSA